MKENFRIDFLCVGFQKCATTTLDAILRQHSGVCLPAIKEVHLGEWVNECRNPLEVLEQKFFADDYVGKKIGIIDPSLIDCPQVIYKYMGSRVKIIFMMRNPVDRLFSYYKMALKFGYLDIYKSTMYGQEIENVSKSFRRYVREELRRRNKSYAILWGNYIDYILDFTKYYGRDMIDIVFFEDFILSPKKFTYEILEFLSLPFESLNYDLRVGEGNCISKNNLCFKINSKIISKREEIRSNPNNTMRQFERMDRVFEKVSKYTTEDNSEKMDAYTRQRLEKYYGESKKRLEEFLNMDLSEKWF